MSLVEIRFFQYLKINAGYFSWGSREFRIILTK